MKFLSIEYAQKRDSGVYENFEDITIQDMKVIKAIKARRRKKKGRERTLLKSIIILKINLIN